MEAPDTTHVEADVTTEPTESGGPEVPHVEHTPQTAEEVRDLADAFAQLRKEVAEVRAMRRGPQQTLVTPVETQEDRQKARTAAIAEHSHYCPGCGRLFKYPRECTGTPAAPHAPIDAVSTDELSGDPDNHTAAPATDDLAA